MDLITPDEHPLDICGTFRPAERYPVGRHATEHVAPITAWIGSPSSIRLNAVVPLMELQPSSRHLYSTRLPCMSVGLAFMSAIAKLAAPTMNRPAAQPVMGKRRPRRTTVLSESAPATKKAAPSCHDGDGSLSRGHLRSSLFAKAPSQIRLRRLHPRTRAR